AAGFLLGFGNRVEHRQPEMGAPALPGRGAPDHLGSIGDRLFGMERAVLAGEALADDLGIAVDEDGHGLFSQPPPARGRSARQRRVGVCPAVFSSSATNLIFSRTARRCCVTSLFQNRRTVTPRSSNHAVRFSSRSCSRSSPCWLPSSSTANRN